MQFNGGTDSCSLLTLYQTQAFKRPYISYISYEIPNLKNAL